MKTSLVLICVIFMFSATGCHSKKMSDYQKAKVDKIKKTYKSQVKKLSRADNSLPDSLTGIPKGMPK